MWHYKSHSRVLLLEKTAVGFFVYPTTTGYLCRIAIYRCL